VASLEEAGLHFVGRDETGQRMEIIEIEGTSTIVLRLRSYIYCSKPLLHDAVVSPETQITLTLLAANSTLNF
jgi:CTP synthase (UTP-ammonia lyase)